MTGKRGSRHQGDEEDGYLYGEVKDDTRTHSFPLIHFTSPLLCFDSSEYVPSRSVSAACTSVEKQTETL